MAGGGQRDIRFLVQHDLRGFQPAVPAHRSRGRLHRRQGRDQPARTARNHRAFGALLPLDRNNLGVLSGALRTKHHRFLPCHLFLSFLLHVLQSAFERRGQSGKVWTRFRLGTVRQLAGGDPRTVGGSAFRERRDKALRRFGEGGDSHSGHFSFSYIFSAYAPLLQGKRKEGGDKIEDKKRVWGSGEVVPETVRPSGSGDVPLGVFFLQRRHHHRFQQFSDIFGSLVRSGRQREIHDPDRNSDSFGDRLSIERLDSGQSRIQENIALHISRFYVHFSIARGDHQFQHICDRVSGDGTVVRVYLDGHPRVSLESDSTFHGQPDLHLLHPDGASGYLYRPAVLGTDSPLSAQGGGVQLPYGRYSHGGVCDNRIFNS